MIDERLGNDRMPERIFWLCVCGFLCGVAADGARTFGEKRVDRFAIVAHGEMNVGKLRSTGIADCAEPVAGLNLVALPYRKAAALKMAILRLPAATMINDKTIAAFTALSNSS